MLDYIIELFSLLIGFFIILAAIVKPRKKSAREWIFCIWAAYAASLTILVLEGTYRYPAQMVQQALVRIEEGDRISLRPFYISWLLYETTSTACFVMNIVGNIILFIPIGFGLPLLFEKFRKTGKMLLFALLLPIVIETAQLFIDRFVDIDDVIYNFIGSMLGFTLYRLAAHFKPTLKNLSAVRTENDSSGS